MRDFNTLPAKWASELRKFVAIDPGYALGDFRKRNIVYKALPEDIQKDVDREVGKGQLLSYQEFMDYVRTIAANYRFRSIPAAKPLTANSPNLIAPCLE